MTFYYITNKNMSGYLPSGEGFAFAVDPPSYGPDDYQRRLEYATREAVQALADEVEADLDAEWDYVPEVAKSESLDSDYALLKTLTESGSSQVHDLMTTGYAGVMVESSDLHYWVRRVSRREYLEARDLSGW